MVAKNVSHDGKPVEFLLSSPLVVVIDPLVLDGISVDLQALTPSAVEARPALLRALPGMMKVGMHRVDAFVQGSYSVGNEDIQPVDAALDEPGVFDVDSGTILLVDLIYLTRLAGAYVDRYDSALGAPVGDDPPWLAIVDEVGGPFFGVLSGDLRTPFAGDGAYRLASQALRRVDAG
jgi:hypothetical protein